VAQRSLDTRGNTLNVECQVTPAPPFTANIEKYVYVYYVSVRNFRIL